MVRVSINEFTTFRWSFEEDVYEYANAGFRSMSVWRQKLADYGEEKGLELLQETGMRVASLLWAGGFTGSDGRSHSESVNDALEAVRLASHLNADCLVLYSGSRAGHIQNHARRLLKSALGDICPAAHACDLTIALEPMHVNCAEDWTFLTSLDETLALIDGLRHNGLKLVFDAYHLAHDPQVVERLPKFVDRLALVQLADATGPPCGEQDRRRLLTGSLPLVEIVRSLEQSGYRGYYDVELMGQEIEMADYRELLAHTRSAVSELFDCAAV